MPPVILCVDDDPKALFVRRLLLSIAGYEVLTASTVEIAQGFFNCNHVDLVITDHLLPDGTGAELVLQMKRLKPAVPVVLLTGWAEVPPGYERANRLLSKSILPEDFLREIATLLMKRDENTSHCRCIKAPLQSSRN